MSRDEAVKMLTKAQKAFEKYRDTYSTTYIGNMDHYISEALKALQSPPAREECERCKDWQKQGLSDTCPSCDAPPPQPVDDREAYSTPEIVSQIALHADMIDELVRRPPTREFYEKLHKSDEILSGLDQRRILLDYIAELQAARSAQSDMVSVMKEAAEYLDLKPNQIGHGVANTICTGSVLHEKMKQAIKSAERKNGC